MISKILATLVVGFVLLCGEVCGQSSVDVILDQEFETHSLTPSEVCSDETFLRRVTVDLQGRIPSIDELRSFLAAPDRPAKIDELLATEEFASSWSETWTAMLVGYGNTNGVDRQALRAWLYQSLTDQVPYNEIARRLISAKGNSALNGEVTFLLRHQEEPAVRVSRIFLGVRLDCARCHDHPFDRWTQSNFEEVSRFFAGMRTRQANGENMELYDDIDQTKKVDKESLPKFFTSASPKTGLWRDELALFVVRSKPFARTFSNRVWYQLMGQGIVASPDDFNLENVPSSKLLLDYLAEQAREQSFDIRSIVRLICNSNAYQRSAAKRSTSPKEIELFASRSIKPMTSEQLVDSVSIALGQVLPLDQRNAFIEETVRTAEDDFSATYEYRETIQGLMMRLTREIKSPTRSLDELFQMTLSRLPTDAERETCKNHSLDDIAFSLINSSEFFFSH
jgi:Protein of unknown function (DUF1549)/Protein of unknown function (DUF1553)